jgi:hypothetical protein
MQVCLKDTHMIELSDVATGATDSLEFSEPVVSFALGYGRLLVATMSQCKVFAAGVSLGSAAPSATVDIHDMLLAMKLAPQCFIMMLASNGIQVCIYFSEMRYN